MRQNAGKVTKPRTIRVETTDPGAAEPLSTLRKIEGRLINSLKNDGALSHQLSCLDSSVILSHFLELELQSSKLNKIKLNAFLSTF